MKHFEKFSFFWVLFLMLSVSCSSSNSEVDINPEDAKLVTLQFSNPVSNAIATDGNSIILPQNLSFFFFSNDGSKNLLYSPKKENIKVSALNNNYHIEIKIPATLKGNLRLEALVNSSNLISSDVNYQDFVRQINYFIKGECESVKVPMWGSVDFTLDGKQTNLSIKLLRSMARANFKIVAQKEDAKFKMLNITSVRVYKSKNFGVIKPYDENFNANESSVNAPSIPNVSAEYGGYNTHSGKMTSVIDEAISDPLLYDYTSNPTDFVENDIFLPESAQKENQDIVTVVVGVQLEGLGDQERFYRVDFAEYNKSTLEPERFFEILRNRSYGFSLNGASTAGEDTPEEAYNKYSKAYVSVKVWEDYSLDFDHIVGDFYFRIDNSNQVNFAAEAGSVNHIKYFTNLSRNDVQKNMKVSVGNSTGDSPYFEIVDVDYENKEIIVKTKTAASTDENKDVLKIQLFKLNFSIQLKQQSK